ncbi:MAG: recombinase family protein [Oscillospiraceae bacterium]|jgi:DNA invertase Pin-like site-specific DNA recombinase|nr:recombinase family protein [Oscillospiraceae bacterium]
MARELDPKAIEARRRKRNASNLGSREAIKQEIREAAEQYRDNPQTYSIPPPPRKNAATADDLLNVALYARVSTPEEEQAGSFEVQIQELKRIIDGNPKWRFCGIYADEGISGTQVSKRKGFQEMIDTAKAGGIDLIITKDMSRFGRNCSEVLENLRTLRNLKPPVGVIFNLLGISSLDPTNELLITILAAVAQLESQQKSIAVKASIHNRMQLGIYKFSVVNAIGYYRDTFGRLKIDDAEAEIVRYIYAQFLEGFPPSEIAAALTSMEIATPKGLVVWRTGTILGILNNEKYNGNP